jgi:cytoskeletal protein CcmA (bactofilin family)/anti-sigma factor RsiW
MNHCDEMTALLYLDGQLDDSRTEEIESHAAICAECRERLRGLEMESAWLRESLQVEEEPFPVRLLNPPRRRMVPWEWAAVLGLSMGGAYTVWSGFVAPWREQAAMAGFTQGNLLTTLFFSGTFWTGWDAMTEMTEFLAMAALALLAVWLLRRHLRSGSSSAVGAVMGALALALALAPSAKAAEIEHGQPGYTLPAGAEVKTDLIVFAGTTRIDGDVDGDLIVWSRDITVNGHVKGDILAWGQEIRVNGPVDGNVRGWCQTLMLDSTVAKNVMTAANQVDLEDKSSVGGTVTAAGGNVELDGQIGGDLLAFTGYTQINGLLGQNAVIHANRLVIGPQAQIKGQAQYTGRRQAEVSPQARLGAPLQTTIFRGRNRLIAVSAGRRIWREVLRWGASFVFGTILLLLMPSFFLDIKKACNRVLPSLGFGVLFLFATPIAALIVCITIVGLGVGLTSLLLWAIALYAAHIFVAAWVGERVLPAAAGLGSLALGLLLLQAVEWVPYLGGWITFLVILWGVGALVLGVYARLQPRQAIV